MTSGRWISMAVTGGVFAAALVISLACVGGGKTLEGSDPSTGLEYSFSRARSQPAGHRIPVIIEVRPDKAGSPGVKQARVIFRNEGEKNSASSSLTRIENSDLWAGALPPRSVGESSEFYFVIDSLGGRSFTIPAGIPAKGRPFSVVSTSRPSRILYAMHTAAVVAAPVALLHGLFFVVLFLSGKFGERGGERAALRSAFLLTVTALVLFTLATLPLGIIVNQQTNARGYDGWPIGQNDTATRSVAVILLWTCLVVFRRDLFRGRADPRPFMDRIFAALFLAATALSILAFILPSSQ